MLLPIQQAGHAPDGKGQEIIEFEPGPFKDVHRRLLMSGTEQATIGLLRLMKNGSSQLAKPVENLFFEVSSGGLGANGKRSICAQLKLIS